MTDANSSQRSNFYLVMCFLAAATILAGFGNVYGRKVVGGTEAIPAIIHVHAAVFCAWLAVLLAQVILVARGRVDLHRRLGWAGAALIPVMLVVGLITSVEATRAGHTGIPGLTFANPAVFLLLNVNAVLVFFVLAALAIYFRGNPQVHKRLMLTATVVALVPPGASRLPVVGPTPLVVPIVLAFVLAGPIHEAITRRRRPHVAWWAAASTLFVLPPVVAGIGSTRAWQGLAESILGAPQP